MMETWTKGKSCTVEYLGLMMIDSHYRMLVCCTEPQKEERKQEKKKKKRKNSNKNSIKHL